MMKYTQNQKIDRTRETLVPTDDGRRGTVLVLVVGILSVLMLLAATIALVSRMELKTSGYYEDSQSAELIVDNLEQYCKNILHQDKFGSDGWPYNYERAEAEGLSLWNTDYTRSTGDNLNGDDEGFDSLVTEEWLPPADGSGQTWRLFNPDPSGGQNDAALIDTTGDGKVVDGEDTHYARWLDMSQALGANYGSLLGGNMQARFALRFVDLGGARVDINATGKYLGASGTAHGGYDYLHYCAEEGTTPSAGTQITGEVSEAEAIIRDTDPDGSEGTLWVDPVSPYLSFVPGEEISEAGGGGGWSAIVSMPHSSPGLSACEIDPRQTIKSLLLDLGQAESAARTNADNAVANLIDQKYGNDTSPGTDGTDEEDVAQDGDMLDYNYDGIVDENTQAIDDYQDVPTEFSGVWPWPDDAPFGTMDLHDLFWGRNRGSRAATLLELVDPTASQDATELQNLGMDLNTNLRSFTTHSGGTVIVSRSLRSSDEWNDTQDSGIFTNLDFLDATDKPQSPTTEEELPLARPLDRLMRQAGGDPIVPSEMVQLLMELGIQDSSGTLNATDMTVQQTALNLCDMLDEDFAPRITTINGKDYVGMEPMPYLAEIEAAVRCPGNTVQNGGPGKFIKLVNPWDVPLSLGNYEIHLPATYEDGTPCLRAWAPQNDLVGGSGTHYFSYSYDADITIDLSGHTIPARGHFLIVDATAEFTNLPSGAHMQAPQQAGLSSLAYMQECDGTPEPDSSPYHDWFEEAPQNWNDAIVPAWLRTMYNDDPGNVHTEIRGRVGEGNGGPSMVQLRYNNQVVQQVILPDDDGADDSGSLSEHSETAQVSDPRPCWTDSSQTDPWPNDHWDTNDQSTRYETTTGNDAWTEDSNDLAYFNRSWRSDTDGTTPVGDGDGWFLLYAPDIGQPPENQDNLLDSFPPVMRKPDPPVDKWTTGVWNTPRLVNPTYLGYVHCGEPWETISLRPETGIWLSRLLDYTVPENGNPYEDGVDNDGDAIDSDGDGDIDANDVGVDENDVDLITEGTGSGPRDGILDGSNGITDRNGPEIRVHGRVNVNTAPQEVIRAVLNREDLLRWATEVESTTSDVQREADDMAEEIAEDIVDERETNGPYTSVADLFERVDALWGDGLLDSNRSTYQTNQCEALARFMAGLITVRTDVWGVVGRVQLFNDWEDDGDGVWENGEDIPPEAIQAERRFYMVLDRSHDPIRVIMKRYLPD